MVCPYGIMLFESAEDNKKYEKGLQRKHKQKHISVDVPLLNSYEPAS